MRDRFRVSDELRILAGSSKKGLGFLKMLFYLRLLSQHRNTYICTMLMQTLPTPLWRSRVTAHAQQHTGTCSSAHWASCRQTVFQGNTRHQGKHSGASWSFKNATSEQRSDAEQGYFGLLNVLKPNANEWLQMKKSDLRSTIILVAIEQELLSCQKNILSRGTF